jgi:hypothetical protein
MLLSKIRIQNSDEIYISSGDVVALYPSIDIGQCLIALEWFISKYMSDL